MIISIPLIIEMPTILTWWLGDYPPFTVILCQLALIDAMIFSISGPLITGSMATGRIKIYQIVVGGLYLLLLPVAFIVLKLGGSPQSTLIVAIVINLITLTSRVYMLRSMISLSMKSYCIKVIFPLILITILSPILPYCIHYSIANNIVRFLLVCFGTILWTIPIIYFIGANKEERIKVRQVAVQYVWPKVKRMLCRKV